MINMTIEDISLKARDLLQNTDMSNTEEVKLEVLFPFIETLGYDVVDPTQVATFPVYDLKGEDYFDYGLIENIDEEKYKIIIKLVNFGESLERYEQLIKDGFMANKEVKYAIITDGIVYNVYEDTANYTFSNTPQITLVNEFNITLFNEDDLDFLRLLSKNGKKINSNSLGAIYEDEKQEEKTEDKKDTKQKIKKERKSLPFLKGIIAMVVLLIGGLVAINVVGFFMNKPPEEKIPNIDNEVVYEDKDIEEDSSGGLFKKFGDKSVGTGIQYINIKSILELHVYQPKNELEINLISDIVEGAIIKYEIINGENMKVLYGKVDKNGESLVRFEIPETWEIPTIQVASYMRFDEDNYKQPKNVINKYGEKGEYIIQKSGYPLYGLTHNSVQHQNDRVIAYLKKQAEEREKELAITRERDFSKLETQKDPDGNIKHVPKGFDPNKVNLRENRNIYPQILYNARTDTVYLQLVIGFLQRQWTMFDKITFTADGNTWSYPVNSNIKKSQVSGSYISEWAYFNNIDTKTLLNDIRILANSKDSRIIFEGASRKGHALTDEEKENLRLFLYIYNTYYKDGIVVPDSYGNYREPIEVDLNYIIEPDNVMARTSGELKKITDLSVLIASKRSNKENTTNEEKLLGQLNSSYRVLDDKTSSELFNFIIKQKGTAIYDEGFEKKEDTYYKIYFTYIGYNGLVEQGYVPYITVYSDKRAHIPLKSPEFIDTSERSLAEITLTDDLYNKLVKTISNTQPKQLSK